MGRGFIPPRLTTRSAAVGVLRLPIAQLHEPRRGDQNYLYDTRTAEHPTHTYFQKKPHVKC